MSHNHEGSEYLIAARLIQRRRQFLVHSFLFHECGESIVPDHKFDSWARELIQLQTDYPELSEALPFNELTKNLGGDLSSEMMGIRKQDYPRNIVSVALHLLRREKKSRQRWNEFAKKYGYTADDSD